MASDAIHMVPCPPQYFHALQTKFDDIALAFKSTRVQSPSPSPIQKQRRSAYESAKSSSLTPVASLAMSPSPEPPLDLSVGVPEQGRRSPAPRATIRSEEGCEVLPAYSCSLNAEGFFQMKMEKSSPFDRSDNRTWNMVFVELRGTMMNVHRVRIPISFNMGTRDRPVEPRPAELIRSYTLQHAEVGVAADYTKRQNTIRIRAEEAQFLLNFPSLQMSLAWLEFLGAAIALALPLDDRSFPRYRTLARDRPRDHTQLVREQEQIIRTHFPQLMVPGGAGAEQQGPSSASGIECPITRRVAAAFDSLRAYSSRAIVCETRGKATSSTGGSQVASRTSSPDLIPRATMDMSLQAVRNARSRSEEPRSRLAPSEAPKTRSASSGRPAPEAESAESQMTNAGSSLMSPSDDGDRIPVEGSSSTDTKWRPTHNWTEAHDIRYACRCVPILNEDSPRRYNVIVRNGKMWKIDWDNETYRRCTPRRPAQPDAS